MPLPYRVALCFLVLRLRHFRRCRQNTEGGTNALRDRQVVVQAAVSAAEHDWDVRGGDHWRDTITKVIIPGRHAVTTGLALETLGAPVVAVTVIMAAASQRPRAAKDDAVFIC